jgi:hypothetical protein
MKQVMLGLTAVAALGLAALTPDIAAANKGHHHHGWDRDSIRLLWLQSPLFLWR